MEIACYKDETPYKAEIAITWTIELEDGFLKCHYSGWIPKSIIHYNNGKEYAPYWFLRGKAVCDVFVKYDPQLHRPEANENGGVYVQSCKLP